MGARDALSQALDVKRWLQRKARELTRRLERRRRLKEHHDEEERIRREALNVRHLEQCQLLALLWRHDNLVDIPTAGYI